MSCPQRREKKPALGIPRAAVVRERMEEEAAAEAEEAEEKAHMASRARGQDRVRVIGSPADGVCVCVCAVV